MYSSIATITTYDIGPISYVLTTSSRYLFLYSLVRSSYSLFIVTMVFRHNLQVKVTLFLKTISCRKGTALTLKRIHLTDFS